MTVRLPNDLGLGVRRYSARTGCKPAKVGALALDEFLRRRDFPLIDFRETAAGRVAYVKGMRLAVYWLAGAVKRLRGDINKVAATTVGAPGRTRRSPSPASNTPMASGCAPSIRARTRRPWPDWRSGPRSDSIYCPSGAEECRVPRGGVWLLTARRGSRCW